MDEIAIKIALLRKLLAWPRGVSQSDLERSVRPVVVRPGLIQEMALMDLLELESIGDEPVARITEHGRAWLSRQESR